MVSPTSRVCISSCHHYTYTAEEDERARKEGKILYDRRNGSAREAQLAGTERWHADYYGCLGQYAVYEMARRRGTPLDDAGSFTDIARVKDTFDYIHKGKKFDVKSSTFEKGWEFIGSNSNFLVRNSQQIKVCDFYVFVKIDFDRKMIHLAGCFPYLKVWEGTGKLYDMRAFTGKAPEPCHYCKAYEVRDWYDFL